MSKRGNETPRIFKRLNDEQSSDEFHAPSFKILSQTQPSYAKDKARSGKSKMKKKTNKQTSKGIREEEKRERKAKSR